MRIRMLEKKQGADDGRTLRTYEAGQEYDMPNTQRGRDLAALFVSEGWAELMDAPRVEQAVARLQPVLESSHESLGQVRVGTRKKRGG